MYRKLKGKKFHDNSRIIRGNSRSQKSLEGLMLMRYLYGKYYYTIGHGVFCGGGD